MAVRMVCLASVMMWLVVNDSASDTGGRNRSGRRSERDQNHAWAGGV
jgi:hypothetical protein